MDQENRMRQRGNARMPAAFQSDEEYSENGVPHRQQRQMMMGGGEGFAEEHSDLGDLA
jgi:hypothetical protein